MVLDTQRRKISQTKPLRLPKAVYDKDLIRIILPGITPTMTHSNLNGSELAGEVGLEIGAYLGEVAEIPEMSMAPSLL